MTKNEESYILGAGLACIDIIREENEEFELGGTAANVLSILAAMGLQTSFIQANYLGVDGEWIIAEMQKRNIETKLFGQYRTYAPHIVEIISSAKHNFVTVCPCCGKKMNELKLPKENHIKKIFSEQKSMINVFFYDRISKGIQLQMEENRNGWNFYEPNSFRNYNSFLKNIIKSDIVKISGERFPNKVIEVLRNDIANSKVRILIVSLGQEGVKFALHDGIKSMSEWIFIPPYPTGEMVDSAGAGDWLTAAFLFYFLKKYPFYTDKINREDIENYLNQAQQFASLSCQYKGAQGILKSQEGIDKLNDKLAMKIHLLEKGAEVEGTCPFCKI